MSDDVLFSPLPLGPLTLPNRVLMAPLTRSRSKQPGDVPWELNATYYAQRASAGLIIAEATQVSAQGKGYAFTPGIYTDEQVAGWKLVTDAVHAAGGLMYLQLWHVGRISHVELQPGGAAPVAPSAIPAKSQTYISATSGMVDVSAPRALDVDEMPGIVAQYRQAAESAKIAGFDGVEIHGANGYLLDQFTRSGTNRRDDAYGGSLAGRLRLPLEVTDAVVEVWGADRVGYRVSPTGTFNDMSDEDPVTTFATLAGELARRGLVYIHVAESFAGGPRDDASTKAIREVFGGVYIANGAYSPETGRARIAEGRADAITWGELFIANPDLPARIRQDGPYNDPDPATFYGGDARGYTDYPTLDGGTGSLLGVRDTDAERQRVQRAVQGDRTAWEELKHRYGPAVHAVLLADGPPERAGDFTEEVFRIADARTQSMQEAAAIGPWFLDMARARAVQAAGPGVKSGDTHRILRALPTVDAEMLVMALAEGMGAEEIARAAGKSPAEVSEALARAKEKLGPELGRLETMLRAVRWTPPARPATAETSRPFPALVPIAVLLVLGAVIAAIFLSGKKEEGGSKIHWTAGRSGAEAFTVGQTLETEAGERARVAVGTIGHVEVEPYSKVTLTREGADEHRLTLAQGRLHAEIDAPPRAFVVAAPGGDAVSLGKTAFVIDYVGSGGGEVDVKEGAVSLVADGSPGAYVPAGARCSFGKERGPGVPYFQDAPVELQAVDPGRRDLLTVPLAATREKDTLTLFHLLPHVDESSREVVILRLLELVPAPASASAEALRALDESALAAYEAELKKHW